MGWGYASDYLHVLSHAPQLAAQVKRLRDVTHKEIDGAARRRGERQCGFNNLQSGPYSTATFAWMTRRWN
jgi:hypothetical protein